MSEINFDFSYHDLISISDYSKDLFTYPVKVAVYTLTDLSFGIMHQLAVLREEEGKLYFQVFRNEKYAIDWLNS